MRVYGNNNLFQIESMANAVRRILGKNKVVRNDFRDIIKDENDKKDMYISSSETDEDKYIIYSNTSKKFPDAILDAINFEFNKSDEKADCFIYNGVKFLKSDIPPVDDSRCLEIKAEDNCLDFQQGKYYKYIDRNGKKHIFTSAYNHVTQPYSDMICDRVDKDTANIGKFWSLLLQDSTYLGLYYSNDEQHQFLNDAGIKEGFFTIKVGERERIFLFKWKCRNSNLKETV